MLLLLGLVIVVVYVYFFGAEETIEADGLVSRP